MSTISPKKKKKKKKKILKAICNPQLVAELRRGNVGRYHELHIRECHALFSPPFSTSPSIFFKFSE